MLFASCDTDDNGGALKHLNFTSDMNIIVEAEGGNVAITYTLKDAVAGLSVETAIVSGEEAIKSITTPTTGVIIVDVKANTGAQRIAIITVSYGDEAANVTIMQKGS